MRPWRVGTLSMGLLLICSGIGLLLAQFDKLVVIDFSQKWWPVIFILLGLEVLVLNFFSREEARPVKYDLFSIIITLLIVATGLGVQAITQLGLMAEARTMISSQVFGIPAGTEIPLESDIQKIVLAAGGSKVSIHSSTGNSILVNSTFQIRAQSQVEAQETSCQYNVFPRQRVGNTLYINLPPRHGSGAIIDGSYALIIPDHLGLEIEGADSSLDLFLASLQNDWEITGSGYCTVILPAGADVTVNALVNNQSALHGNLAWTTSKTSPVGNPAVNTQAGDEEQVQAQLKLGNGSHKMNILGMDDLTVNCLP